MRTKLYFHNFKVLGSFTLFLCWYAPFILAFGIGFYIMLHSPDAGFFGSPWLALVKTSTMFVGELEFADLPIQQASLISTKVLLKNILTQRVCSDGS